MTLFDKFHPFLISLVISLIVGIERERSHPAGTQAAGVRTFMLIGLLGTLAAFIGSNSFTGVVTAFVGGLILVGYWRSDGSKFDRGLTTEISAFVIFGLGFLANSERILALALGVAVFAILFSRKWLHKFSRETLRPAEIQAALTLGVILVGVIPFLPDHAIDPWNLVNLRNLASVISALATIQFASYVAVRWLGAKAGIMLSGFFGGLISSTSVFATFPSRASRQPDLFHPVLAALLLATSAMLLEAMVIVAMTAPALIMKFGIPVGAMSLLCLSLAMALGKRARIRDSDDNWKTTNPLDLVAVLKMALLISLMLFLIALMNRWAGPGGGEIVAFLGGLFELHGVAFATATLFAQKQLEPDPALDTLALAIVAAFISKFVLLWVSERNRLSLWATCCLTLVLGAGGITFWLV